MTTQTNTVVISTSTAVFVFDPPMGQDTQKCKMTITVTEKCYEHEEHKPHWYYIDYSYTYIEMKTGAEKSADRCHMFKCYRHPSNPFYGVKNVEDEYQGTIIKKNEMTEPMIKYLLMPFNDLDIRKIGRRCPQQYKRQVIHSISNFW